MDQTRPIVTLPLIIKIIEALIIDDIK